MKMWIRGISTAALLGAALLLPTSVSAQLELGVDIGYERFSRAVDGDDMVSTVISTLPRELRLGLSVSDRLLVESGIRISRSSISVPDDSHDSSAWAVGLTPGIAWLFGQEGKARPYLRVKGGFDRFSGPVLDDVTRWQAGGAGGVRIPLNDWVLARFEASFVRVFEGDDLASENRLGLKAGFSAIVN